MSEEIKKENEIQEEKKVIIVGINFREAGKIYYFSPGKLTLTQGDKVIVETARGVELGTVKVGNKEVSESDIVSPLKPVTRVATKEDLERDEKNRRAEADAIEICKKNNLQYFLLHGSCIGAVRHKGFIPWDDDIDVGMPREDYDRFTEIAKDQLPMHLFFQTFETDPEYPTAFGKIRNSNTTYFCPLFYLQILICRTVYVGRCPTPHKPLKRLDRNFC